MFVPAGGGGGGGSSGSGPAGSSGHIGAASLVRVDARVISISFALAALTWLVL